MSQVTIDMFEDLIVDKEVSVESSGCHGKCGSGPNVHCFPSDQEYAGVFKPSTAAAIVEVEFGILVSDAAVAAYKKKMYGDQVLREEEFREALRHYSEGLSILSQDASMQEKERQKVRAATQLSRATALRKLANRATEAERGDLLREGEAASLAAIDDNPSCASAWFMLCECRSDLGLIDEALRALDEAEAAVPELRGTEGVMRKRERFLARQS